MGATERREREKEEVRRKILDAAQELFAREGYEQVTMRRLADAIEYSPTAIYYHFEDKDDVVHSLCQELFGKLFAAVSQRDAPDDPVEQIRQLGRAYGAFGLRHPNHYRFMFMTPKPASHKPEPGDGGYRAFGLLRQAVERAIEAGRFAPGDPHAIATVLWASLHGAVALVTVNGPEKFPEKPPPPDLIDQVIDAGIRAFLAPEAKEK